MSLKILGGAFRGFKILTPDVQSTRPTSVLVKRKLFDWCQNLEGRVFVDLFAGSGAMGFEALSRGADKIFLNESSHQAYKNLKINQARVEEAFKEAQGRVHIFSKFAADWISTQVSYQGLVGEEVIFYVDPPYEKHLLYFECLKLLREAGVKGEIWLESDKFKGPSQSDVVEVFSSVVKSFEHGDHFVVVGKLG